jgi:nitrile hydratase
MHKQLNRFSESLSKTFFDPLPWYKLKPFRARAVKEPRALLAEFGTVIPDDVAIHVSDSTAAVRYMVLPQRPKGTENFSEEKLASLVTRDVMIGVALISLEP